MRTFPSGRILLALALSVPILVAFPGSAAADVPVTEVAASHDFDNPLYLTNAGDDRLFVVEQRGLIKIIHDNGSVSTFLDLSDVVSQSGNERGLLGLAFHPNYATNGLFYVNYTRESNGATVVAEFKVSTSDPDVANRASWRRVMRVDQPAANHNGGWMAFNGPYLYIAFGDGGGAPGNRAQSLNTFLGKILRINPLDPPGSATYRVPSDNPYVGRDGKDAIWARGFRNPWRCSFDRLNADLWCADVGQNEYEEVNRVDTGRGLNFGWQLLEGFHYYSYPGRTRGNLCTTKCKTLPILEYSHTANDSFCGSVTGGYVSRRTGANMYGKYAFADYCSTKLWIIDDEHVRSDPLPTPTVTGFRIASFGEGADGRLYIVDLEGAIYRMNDS